MCRSPVPDAIREVHVKVISKETGIGEKFLPIGRYRLQILQAKIGGK